VAALVPVGLGLAGGQTVGGVGVGEQGADGVLGIGVDLGGVALERGSGGAQLARCLLRVLQDLPVAAEVLVLAVQGLAALFPLVDAAGGALELGGAVVAGEVLAAVAREGSVEMMAVGEGLAVGVEVDALAMATSSSTEILGTTSRRLRRDDPPGWKATARPSSRRTVRRSGAACSMMPRVPFLTPEAWAPRSRFATWWPWWSLVKKTMRSPAA